MFAILFEFAIVEMLLIGTISFLGQAEISFITPGAMLVIQAIAFIICLLVWLWTACTSHAPSQQQQQTNKTSGAEALIHATDIYFFVATVLHLFSLMQLIAFFARFGHVTETSFTINSVPHVVLRDILELQLFMFLMLLVVVVYDWRNRHNADLIKTTYQQ